MTAPSMPLEDFIALAEQVARGKGTQSDLARKAGVAAPSARNRLIRNGRRDLAATLADNAQAQRNERIRNLNASGREKSWNSAVEKREARFEDIRFMLAGGRTPEVIARSFGVTQEALHVQAIRWGQRDIADAFSALPCTRNRPSRTKQVAA